MYFVNGCSFPCQLAGFVTSPRRERDSGAVEVPT